MQGVANFGLQNYSIGGLDMADIYNPEISPDIFEGFNPFNI